MGKRVVWIGGTEVRDVPAADVLAERGKPVEVPDDVAGVAPSWRPLAVGERVEPWQQTRTVGDGDAAVVEVYDLGHGLLAQVDCWRQASDEVPAPAGGKVK